MIKVMVNEAGVGIRVQDGLGAGMGDQGWVGRAWGGTYALGVERKRRLSKDTNKTQPAIIGHHLFKCFHLK